MASGTAKSTQNGTASARRRRPGPAGRAAARRAGCPGHADDAADQRRDRHLEHVRRDHLRRGEPDRLQHADPPGPGHHRAADHVGHDQHRHHEPDQAERDDERHPRRDPAGRLQLCGQLGLRAGQRAAGQGAADLAMSASTCAVARAGEAVQHLGRGGRALLSSAAISAGVTQPCAVLVIEVATPTTVSRGCRARLTVTCLPGAAAGPGSPPRRPAPGRAQWPLVRTRSSTGPPGEARPTRFSWVLLRPDAAAAGQRVTPYRPSSRERPGGRRHPGQAGGRAEFGGAGPCDRRGDLRAVLRGERVVERCVGVDEHAECERGGGGGDQQHHPDDDGLDLPPGQAPAGGPDGRDRFHRCAPIGLLPSGRR